MIINCILGRTMLVAKPEVCLVGINYPELIIFSSIMPADRTNNGHF